MSLNPFLNVQSLRRALRVAVLLLCGWTLAACSPEAILVDYLKKKPSSREGEARWYLLRDDGVEQLQEISPELAMFAITRTEREWTEIFEDKNFYSYAIGIYLALYPGITYEEFRKKVDVPSLADLPRETFNYYRGFGRALLEADWVHAYEERLELLKARFPGPLVDGYYIDWFDVGRLLRDDDRLIAVLTDDDAARQFLDEEWKKRRKSEDERPRYYNLGPVFTGVTPGTGS